MHEEVINVTTSMLRYVVLIMAIMHISLFLYNLFKLCSFGNIQIDFGEGIMLGNAERLLELKTIYPSLTDGLSSYVVNANYWKILTLYMASDRRSIRGLS